MKKTKEKIPKAKPGLLYIRGVGVNTNSSAIKDAKTVEDLKKTELFSHLSEKDQEDAYSELAQQVLE